MSRRERPSGTTALRVTECRRPCRRPPHAWCHGGCSGRRTPESFRKRKLDLPHAEPWAEPTWTGAARACPALVRVPGSTCARAVPSSGFGAHGGSGTSPPPHAEGRLHLPPFVTCKRKETWGATAPAPTQCPGSPGHLGGPGSPRFPPAPWGCGPCNEGTVSGGAEQPRLPQPALEGSLVHGAASADPEGGQSYSLVSWLVTRAPGGVRV